MRHLVGHSTSGYVEQQPLRSACDPQYHGCVLEKHQLIVRLLHALYDGIRHPAVWGLLVVREVGYLREQKRHDVLRRAEVKSPVPVRVDGVEYRGVLRVVGRQGVLQLLGVLVEIEVDATVVASGLVDEDVVEVVAYPLHANYAQGWDVVVDDVLPSDFALYDIGADDVHDVVADVEKLDEVVELLLDEVLNLLIQPVGDVLREVEPYELASRRHSEEVRRDFVDAPVALRKLRYGAILPKPLRLVRDERDVVVVELVRDIAKERRGDSRVLKGDYPLLVDDLLNLRGIGLKSLEVPVLCQNLNPVLALLPSIARPLGVELVHSVNWAC